jgi:hypothetical protein
VLFGDGVYLARAQGSQEGRGEGRGARQNDWPVAANILSTRAHPSRYTALLLRNNDTMKPLSGPAVSLTRHCQRPVNPLTKGTPSTPRRSGLPAVQRRGYQQDVQITRTGKPIISIQGGRCVVTVRYLFSELIEIPDPRWAVNSIPTTISVPLLTSSKDIPRLFSAPLASLGDTL